MSTITNNALRSKVIRLYLDLLFTSKDVYAQMPLSERRNRIKKAFLKNADLKDEKQISEALNRGYYVQKEMEALIDLSKYRTMKRRYYNPSSILEEELKS